MYSFRRVVIDLYNISVCEHVQFEKKKLQILKVPRFKLKFQFFISINSLCCCLRADDVLKN